MMALLTLLLLLTNLLVTTALTCDEIHEIPENKKLTMQELRSIKPDDMVQCLPQLTKGQINKTEANYIWCTIVEYHGGVTRVPDAVLATLGFATVAITVEDIENLTMSDIDVVRNFGKTYGLDDEQLSAVAERIRNDFGDKSPEDFTVYDLTALGQILCAFNRSEIEKIHPSAYREAALTVGKLEKCNSEVMSAFATLAVQKEAFGPPETWDKQVLHVLGAVAEFLPRGFGNTMRANVENP